jgi:hypothetical protein
MNRLFAVVLAVACVAGSTSGFARGGMGHFAGGGRGGHGVNPAFLQNPAPQMRLRKPESGPARVTLAGTHYQWADVPARIPGYDRDRAITPPGCTAAWALVRR